MDPRPTPAALGDYYRRTYWAPSTRTHAPRMRKERRWAEHIARTLLPMLEGRKGPRILEVGSAFGSTLALLGEILSPQSPELYAIEPSPEVIEAGGSRYTGVTLLGPTLEATFEQEIALRFDAIILSHVVEHLVDPVGSLSRLVAHLAPGGVVYLEVPNFQYHPSIETTHLHCFTEESLRFLASRVGLTIAGLRLSDHDRDDIPMYLTAVATPNGAEPGWQRPSIGRLRVARAVGRGRYAARTGPRRLAHKVVSGLRGSS